MRLRGADGETHDHGEVAWRLRHLKRSVLKDAASGLIDVAGASGSFLDDSLDGLGWAVGLAGAARDLAAGGRAVERPFRPPHEHVVRPSAGPFLDGDHAARHGVPGARGADRRRPVGGTRRDDAG